MSEVKADDQTVIKTIDDVRSLYQGVGRENAKSGLEIERSFYDPKSPSLDAMSLAQNRVLKHSAMEAMPDVDWVHNEPTSELLEVATSAVSFKDIKAVIAEANEKVSILSERAEGIGLKRSYFQELPEKTADELLSRIVEVDRYQIMYAPYRDDMRDCVRYFAVCKSNQVSVSPYSADHMHDNVRRLYALAPFLFLLTDNSTGFCEGQPFTGHIGMALRHKGLQQGRGGVPSYVFESRHGDEFVEAHINHVMNNPLFMYYTPDGSLQRVPSGDWSVTFNSLRERGLNTTSNYNLGQSVLWPDVKIASLKDKNGKTFSHRYEARMFGVGIHQHQSAYILTSALAFDENFAHSVDELLERYGFDRQNGTQAYNLLLESYKAAREHNGQFMDIPYGTGRMLDFAREFSDLVEEMADDHNLSEEVHPILTICRSGCTDGKINRFMFPTLEDVLKFQAEYDPEMFKNSNFSARSYFEDIAPQNNKNVLNHCTK